MLESHSFPDLETERDLKRFLSSHYFKTYIRKDSHVSPPGIKQSSSVICTVKK